MEMTLNEASHGLMCGAVPGFPVSDWVTHKSQSSGQHCRQLLTLILLKWRIW